MNALRYPVSVAAIILPALAGWMLQAAPAAPVAFAVPSVERSADAVASVKDAAPRLLPVGMRQAHALHTHLMAEANAIKVSKVMPLPLAHSAGMNSRNAERKPARDALSDVPDGRKIALFFTGNVIGETDPCG